MSLLHATLSKRMTPIRGLDAFILRFYIILSGLFFVGIIFAINGVNPLKAYFEVIRISFFTSFGLTQTMLNFIPLLLIGLGIALPARCQIDNIGAEGQLIVGAIGAFWIAHSFPTLPSVFLIPLIFLGGFVFGAIWAIPIALFRAKGGFRGADVVVSFLLVFPADFLLIYLVNGPWESSAGRGFPQTDQISEKAQIPVLFSSEIHITMVIGLLVAFILYFLFYRSREGIPTTKLGYELRVLGNNQVAGKISGMSYFKIALITIIISGGLAGIAGVGELAGNRNNLLLRPGISLGLGFTGIAVAWLGGLKPAGVILSAFLFAGLLTGNLALQGVLGLPKTTVNLLNGSLLFLVLVSEFFMRYTIKRRVVP